MSLKTSVLSPNGHYSHVLYFLSQKNTSQCIEGKGETRNSASLCPGWNCFQSAPCSSVIDLSDKGAISPWHREAFSVVICLGSPESRQNLMKCGLTEHLSLPGGPWLQTAEGTHVVITRFVRRTPERCRTCESFSKMTHETTHLFQDCQKRAPLLLHPNHPPLFSDKSLKNVKSKKLLQTGICVVFKFRFIFYKENYLQFLDQSLQSIHPQCFWNWASEKLLWEELPE